jgi:hypothetical protein
MHHKIAHRLPVVIAGNHLRPIAGGGEQDCQKEQSAQLNILVIRKHAAKVHFLMVGGYELLKFGQRQNSVQKHIALWR